jgi:hypothetical protein
VHLLEAKVIQTKLEKEIFIDQVSNIELDKFHYPDNNTPYFEFLVGLILGRIRDKEFYGIEKVYFGIKMTEDLQSIIVFDPDKESIFAARNEQEKIVVTELINYVLTESPNFKQVLKNIINETETQKAKVKRILLEQLLNLQLSDIKFEIQKKITAR